MGEAVGCRLFSAMARADDALLCPACGARNKAKWEFCARCGESLQGAETPRSPKKAETARKDERAGARRGRSRPRCAVVGPSGSPLWAGLAVVALVATVAAGVWYALQKGPAPGPRAAGLTVPTQPAKPEPPPVPAQGKAQEPRVPGGLQACWRGTPPSARRLSGRRRWPKTPSNAALPAGLRRGPDQDRQRRGRGARGHGRGRASRSRRLPHELCEVARRGRPQGRGRGRDAGHDRGRTPTTRRPCAAPGWYLCQQKDFARGLPLLRRAAELRPERHRTSSGRWARCRRPTGTTRTPP